MKIIITEKIAEDASDFLLNNGFLVDVKLGISHEELLQIIDLYDGIIVRSATQINKEIIEKATNLKVVGRAGNGVDNIDVATCTSKGIVVVNTPESNIMAAAELTVALIFCVFRCIPQAHMAAKNNDFRRNKFKGNELNDKVAGIVGLGRISSIVASRLKGCNMKVIAYDPFVTDEMYKMLGITRCKSLEELLEKSDVITVHTPKTALTYGMIGEKEFELCKKGVRIVNVARGGIINEKALYNAIVSEKVAAAAIDVLDPEPNFNKTPEEQDYKNQLLELDNVIITPHLGASTEEATYNVSTAVTKLVADCLNGEMVAAVNMPSIKVKNLAQLKPYLDLAEMLGKIYYQLEKETVEKIEIVYSGDLAEKETDVITLSVLRGFLEPISKERVNYVNASHMLKGMGIDIIESKSSHLEKYTNLITVKFITKTGNFSVSGTIFAKEEIRIVDIFGYKLDFEPMPYVLAIKNNDIPGMIGKIGTALSKNNINIASMQLSRNKKGDIAASYISVDGEVSNQVIEFLKNIEGIVKVSMMRF